MLIDWFTVVAQAVNFLILVWLLKRFLYEPILKALDAREHRIASELANADSKQTEAIAERKEYMRKNEEFDRQRAAMLSKAMEEATVERQRLFDEVHKEVEVLRTKLHDRLSSEFRNMHEEFAQRTQVEVFAIVRQALNDLANESLEEHIIAVFLQRIRSLNSDEKARLGAIFNSPFQTLQVRSAFELESAQRTEIENTIKEALATTASVRFEIEPNLINGLELVIQGQKVAWSITDYLTSLENDVSNLLNLKRKSV